MRLEVLVFNRDDRLPQDGSKILVIDDDPAFQGKGTESPALLVVKVGCG
jgi:hypothetical protein